MVQNNILDHNSPISRWLFTLLVSVEKIMTAVQRS